jgi:hypothetical protein
LPAPSQRACARRRHASPRAGYGPIGEESPVRPAHRDNRGRWGACSPDHPTRGDKRGLDPCWSHHGHIRRPPPVTPTRR